MSALLWLPLRSQFWADNGVELLTNGGFETPGGPPPTGWGSIGSVPYRTVGTRTGGTGSWMCEIGWDGVNVSGRATQSVMTAARRYHPSVWYQTDGVTAVTLQDGLAGISKVGVASATWQFLDTIGVAAHARLDLMNNGALGAGKYVRFDDASLQEQFMYTANEGSLKGKVQLGDGRTAATFPAQLAGRRGWSFNGSGYALLAQPISGTYTFVALLTNRWVTGAKYILDARASGGTGYIWYSGAPQLETSSGTIYVDGIQTTTLTPYKPSVVAVAGMTLNAPGNTALFTFNGVGAGWIGDAQQVGLFPGTLTPTQLRDIEYRMRAEANL